MPSAVTPTEEHPTYASFKFNEPDLSVPPEKRGFFAPIPGISTTWVDIPLHDYRQSDGIAKGPAGLDEHGFTMINHQSALSGEQWFSQDDVKNLYFPEIQELVKSVTGAHTVICQNASFRRRAVVQGDDPKFYMKKGEGFDKDISKVALDKPIVMGTTVDTSREPARIVHCDYAFKGLQQIIRYDRPDMIEAGSAAVLAEQEALKEGSPYKGPRYAAFSIWRPIKQVQIDPLAVSDFRTVEPNDFVPYEMRAPYFKGGEYRFHGCAIKPPKDASKQRWYWLPKQKEDEVWFVKLSDSEAVHGNVAGGVAHCSPKLSNVNGRDARESIEVRVVAFW